MAVPNTSISAANSAIMLLTGFTSGLRNASLAELSEDNLSPVTPHLRVPTVCFHKQRTTYVHSVHSIWMTQSVRSASSKKSASNVKIS